MHTYLIAGWMVLAGVKADTVLPWRTAQVPAHDPCFHGYDAQDYGRSKLRIEKLMWVDDWPVVRR